jgi:hypothetical protein
MASDISVVRGWTLCLTSIVFDVAKVSRNLSTPRCTEGNARHIVGELSIRTIKHTLPSFIVAVGVDSGARARNCAGSVRVVGISPSCV